MDGHISTGHDIEQDGRHDCEQVWRDTREHVENRAVIEQTKGMLMLLHGIDAAAAFDLLKAQSQQDNVKLRLVAEQVRADVLEWRRANATARRLTLDGPTATGRKRLPDQAVGRLDGLTETVG